VDSVEALNAGAIVISAAVLGYASLLDWKTRRVPNKFWILLSVAAMIVLLTRLALDEAKWEYLAVLVPIAAVLSDVYLDTGSETKIGKAMPFVKYGIAAVSTFLLGYLWGDDRYFAHLLTIPVMMLVIVVLYAFDVIKGGADAKALMALSIMFPFAPVVGSMPVIQGNKWYADVVLPFSFGVLVTAAIAVAFLPLVFLVRNIANRELEFPLTLLGIKMGVGEAKGKFVWLMERVENDKVVKHARVRSDEDLDEELRKLETAGRKRVWVTPKIPFIIPMFLSLLFCSTVGNLLLLFLAV
jgi:preflagellin peptidase FlaK